MTQIGVPRLENRMSHRVIANRRITEPYRQSIRWVRLVALLLSTGAALQAQADALPQYLKASNAGAGDNFGFALAAEGDTLVVGASAESGDGSSPDDDSQSSAGAVYVFERSDDGDWVQQAYLKASNAEAGDGFGISVAISGDTIVVGAIGESSDDGTPEDNLATASGAVYVFVRNEQEQWTQQALLKASNFGVGDFFGNSVSVSGDWLLVGAYSEDGDGSDPADDSADEAGAAYVFKRDSGGNWTQQAYLKAANAEAADLFGFNTLLHQGVAFVSATGEASDGSNSSDNSAPIAGAVYAFEADSEGVWQQTAYLKASNADSEDFFGVALTADDNLVAISAQGERSNGSGPDDDSLQFAGAVYVFKRIAQGAYEQAAYIKSPAPKVFESFGRSVALRGDDLLVGAIGSEQPDPKDADEPALLAGGVFRYEQKAPGQWVYQEAFASPNPDSDDLFGIGVALTEHAVIAGAALEDGDGTSPEDNSASDAGAVYVFQRPVLPLPPLVFKDGFEDVP